MRNNNEDGLGGILIKVLLSRMALSINCTLVMERLTQCIKLLVWEFYASLRAIELVC